jgi:alpha-D-ribose 1-methylphosphonate 5-triphosphate synthase subunit PhnG
MSTGTSNTQGSNAETGLNKSKDSRGPSGVNRSFKLGNNSITRSDATGTGIEELKGHIFTYGTQGQQSNYIRTKKALADYVGTKFRFAKELYRAINGEEEVELV